MSWTCPTHSNIRAQTHDLLVFVMSDPQHLFKKWRNCLFSSKLRSGAAMLHKDEVVVKEEDTVRLYNPIVESNLVHKPDMAVGDFHLVWDSIEELDKSCVVSGLL